MAFILGLILTFLLGGGIGAWAMFDWTRYREVRFSATASSERVTQVIIDQILEDYDRSGAAHLAQPRHFVEGE